MFLEETIEAMEMMEDSGLSNDELDFGHKLESNNPPTVNGIIYPAPLLWSFWEFEVHLLTPVCLFPIRYFQFVTRE